MAEAAGLHYCSDDEPGIRRRRSGSGFRYLRDDRRPVAQRHRKRIEGLVIPPAWTDVWISSDPDSHLQVTGRDDRDRKQYLYHERWSEVRDQAKFDHLATFADALIEIRKQVDADLARAGLGRDRVAAAVVRLLDTSLIRVGNERYAAENDTFGATTLEPRHVHRLPGGYRLDFAAKSGVERMLEVRDPELTELIGASLRCRQPQLFCFRDDSGAVIDLTSAHVNDYLHAVGGPSVSAKVFRTWGASAVAIDHFCAETDPQDRSEQRCIEAVDVAAEALGNTRAVCRSCYVAPVVLEAAESGTLTKAWNRSRSGQWRTRPESTLAKILN